MDSIFDAAHMEVYIFIHLFDYLQTATPKEIQTGVHYNCKNQFTKLSPSSIGIMNIQHRQRI